jgi:hypothetical protein
LRTTSTRALFEVAPDLWASEAPLRYLGFEMGRRMAVVRLRSGDLLIHSPAPLSHDLRKALDRLGAVRFIVAASILHGHRDMGRYADAYPLAELCAVAGLERRRPDLRFDRWLSPAPEPEWADDLDQMLLDGQRLGRRDLNEFEFMHRKTRTLITGDLVFNIGPEWPLRTRLLAWGPAMRTRLGPTVAFRLGIRDREAARKSVTRMLEWDFDRILPGHGEIIESGGKAALTRDLAWLLQ